MTYRNSHRWVNFSESQTGILSKNFTCSRSFVVAGLIVDRRTIGKLLIPDPDPKKVKYRSNKKGGNYSRVSYAQAAGIEFHVKGRADG